MAKKAAKKAIKPKALATVYVVSVRHFNSEKKEYSAEIPVGVYRSQEAADKAQQWINGRSSGTARVTECAIDVMPKLAYCATGGKRLVQVREGLAVGHISVDWPQFPECCTIRDTPQAALDDHYTKEAAREAACN